MQDATTPVYDPVDANEMDNEKENFAVPQKTNFLSPKRVQHPAILLLGQMGAGKSTFGNWLLGFDDKNCNSYSSKTLTIIKSFLGDQALEHMIVAFSHCNVNQTTDDENLQRALNNDMKSFLASVNNRYIVSPNPDLFHQGEEVVCSNIEKAKLLIDSFDAAYTTEMFNRVREAREAIEREQEERLPTWVKMQMDEYEREIQKLKEEVDRVGQRVAYNEASGKCFKLDTKVILEIGKTVPISSVVVGDRVCVDASNGHLEFSEVYLIAHYDPEAETEFLKIEFTSPRTGLTDHHIMINNYFDFARNVQPYSTQLRVLIDSQMQLVRVANVTTEIHKGYIAIFTRAGTLVADNVMCSCYASVAPYQSTINAFLSPLMFSTKLKKSDYNGKEAHPYLEFLYNRYRNMNWVFEKVSGKGISQ
ncbi:10927_t:CDS:2 [Acaulospora colombiana]|uniref:10927_t:CDS:1 n=1 Tax=Acaulospora colombiana TaxID=27376 RepID=A0ACA9M273_9GLOM|nr:10927_t:CDS:2 [Acaulospora colombiana]